MNWWDYRIVIDHEKDGSFRRQIQGQPPGFLDPFSKEITVNERFGKESELTMPFKHETYSSIICNTGTFVIESRPPKIKNVIFNDPATIVFWGDGTKTVVKCENEEFDKEKGLAMAFMKKMLGNKGRYFNEVKKWTRQDAVTQPNT